jgi:hypothetical protein
VIILALVLLFAWVLRRLSGGRLLLPGQDRGRSRQPRLGIVDIFDLDRQRQLILLRRDNVEHLLLVGGPNDVVIETNIVRVPGARLQGGSNEPVVERPEPVLETPARPLVEPAGRGSMENQLAAQLGTLIRRPSEESDAQQELAPVASVSAPIPAPILPPQPEPLLKPTRVEPSLAVPSADIRRIAPEPPRRPEPPRPAAPRSVPPPPTQPETAPPVDPPAPDAGVLSDMARQLEQALKRPSAPAPVVDASPPSPPPPVAEIPPPPPPPAPSSPTVSPFPIREDRRPVEPQAQSPRPAAAEPVKAAPAPLKEVTDPFSVEEIEAEFARLLGRPGEKS